MQSQTDIKVTSKMIRIARLCALVSPWCHTTVQVHSIQLQCFGSRRNMMEHVVNSWRRNSLSEMCKRRGEYGL